MLRTLGIIILFFIIFIFFVIELILQIYKNPNSSNNKSKVTLTYLGYKGDMGNQLFQLACLYAAAKRSNADIVLTTESKKLEYNELFDLGNVIYEDIHADKIYREWDNYENIVIPNDGKNYDIHGYRQSYHYFEDYDVKKLFKINEDILTKVKNALPKEFIAIHMRKGDYYKIIHNVSPSFKEFNNCNDYYYIAGIKKIRKQFPNLPIIVCSNNKEIIDLEKINDTENENMISFSPKIEGIKDKFIDFCTLYLSKALIISNSSYSFWAAYLGEHDIVICPSPWWDNNGFLGYHIMDNNNYYYPTWILLNPKTGKKAEKEPEKEKTLNFFRLIRGFVV